MALDAAAIEIEHREVLLRDKPTAMIDASPKGTVPVLVTDDGITDERVIDESLDIMVWALSQNDPEGWLANQTSDRADAETFLDKFKHHLDRYKYASRYDPDITRGTVDHHHRAVAMKALIALSHPLNTESFLRGKTASLLDVATFPFVRQFAAVEPDWWAEIAPQPLQEWLNYWLSSERFQRIMTKHPIWEPNSPKG